MIKNQDQDEFIAVRVQDPRVQNEGSWNSYVDFKIFLHTNSKAFTAKTSCVRRRYSEFVWLKKKLQKNAGLVPVPELPSKSFFSFNNEDFIEKRRKGLQFFLDKVVHLTVCLSDSQLHLFLQTQLPVSHIQDCVMGLTPYTVTDAILTYASSNQGWAQAQEEDADTQEQCPTPVPYESMESPAPHVPSSQHGAHPAPTPAASQEAAAAAVAVTADSVTVDVHHVNLVELTTETQKEKVKEIEMDLEGAESHVDDSDPTGDSQVEAVAEVHPRGVDLEVVSQENALEEENATEGAQENSGGVGHTALEAGDQAEGIWMAVRLVEEQTITNQQREDALEVVLDETVHERTVEEEQNEEEEETVTARHAVNVELLEQEESGLSSASANDTFVSESAVGLQGLAEPSHNSGVCENENSQDHSEKCTVQNGPVEEHEEDQSQHEESGVQSACLPVERESPVQTAVDESLCVEKAEEEEEEEEEDTAEKKILESVSLQSREDHHEGESIKTNSVMMSNGHSSDSSVTSAIEESVEEGPESELILQPIEEVGKAVSTNMTESVVSGNTEHHKNDEKPLEGCDLKGQTCHGQIGQPYTNLSALEDVDEDPSGIPLQEQDVSLINHMTTP